MQITIKGHRQLKVDPNLRAYIEEKLRKYEPMIEEPAYCDVVLIDAGGPKGGIDKVVKINLTLPGMKNPIFVCERTSDFIGSIDLAQERLEHQILKYKDKIKIGTRFPAKYWLAKMYEKGTFGPRWVMRKLRRKSKKSKK